jgi:hypothetical protein
MTRKFRESGFGKLALRLYGGILYKRFVESSRDCRASSASALRRILEYAKDSEWGRAHGFPLILLAEDDDELFRLFRANVPVSDYDELRPFIERCKNGEPNVLFPGHPKMYSVTSGTSGEPKWIPVSEAYHDVVYKKMTVLWLYSLLKLCPAAFDGKAVSVVGSVVDGEVPDGTVFGSVSGLTSRDIPWFLSGIHSVCEDVFKIDDFNARYYAIMRIGIEQDVTALITANPSTIMEMQNVVDSHLDDFIRDIENGTLCDMAEIPGDIRARLSCALSPNVRRANELRELRKKHGRLFPKDFWPNLAVVSTWKTGNSGMYAEKIKDYFPEKAIHIDLSYFATECRAGITLDGSDTTVLFPGVHFFEFVPEKDIGKKEPQILGIDEIEDGKQYSVYVTTLGGLYRYPMNDLVVVDGFFGTIPRIRFVQKINGIVSITGEKLHERQFVEAVRFAEDETGFSVRFFVGFADIAFATYRFYYEFEYLEIPGEDIEFFNSVVDEKLKSLNIDYESKRNSFRLKCPVPYPLERNSFLSFRKSCFGNGNHDGQFKMTLLMQDEEKHRIFRGLVRK